VLLSGASCLLPTGTHADPNALWKIVHVTTPLAIRRVGPVVAAWMPCGIFTPSLDAAKQRRQQGYRMVVTANDMDVLARGFTLVRDADGRMLRRAAEVSAGERLDIEFADGHVPAEANAGERKAAASPKRARARGSEKQGTLL